MTLLNPSTEPCLFQQLLDSPDVPAYLRDPPDLPAWPEKDFFGVTTLDLLNKAYALFQVQELSPSAIVKCHPTKNENLAASHIRQCVMMQHTHDIFHCIVRAVALLKFVELIDNTPARMLPFSCFSERGTYKEGRHRQSRHFIIVYPKGRFEEEIWKHVTIPEKDKPVKDYKCCFLFPIKTQHHLIKTIMSLSTR